MAETLPMHHAQYKVTEDLISAINAFDVEAALVLFTPDAEIDDPSTGDHFIGRIGIRDYLERYFVGYHTKIRLLSIAFDGARRANMRVDFTGDFGHEIGLLEISFNGDGLIVRIDADLE